MVSSAASISLELGRSSDAPYATHNVWSIVAGGDTRNKFDSGWGRWNGVGAFARACDEGGGVISEDEDGRSGENRFVLSEDVAMLQSITGTSGEADMVV